MCDGIRCTIVAHGHRENVRKRKWISAFSGEFICTGSFFLIFCSLFAFNAKKSTIILKFFASCQEIKDFFSSIFEHIQTSASTMTFHHSSAFQEFFFYTTAHLFRSDFEFICNVNKCSEWWWCFDSNVYCTLTVRQIKKNNIWWNLSIARARIKIKRIDKKREFMQRKRNNHMHDWFL